MSSSTASESGLLPPSHQLALLVHWLGSLSQRPVKPSVLLLAYREHRGWSYTLPKICWLKPSGSCWSGCDRTAGRCQCNHLEILSGQNNDGDRQNNDGDGQNNDDGTSTWHKDGLWMALRYAYCNSLVMNSITRAEV